MKKISIVATALLLGVTVWAAPKNDDPYSRQMARSQGKAWTHGKPWDYVNGLVAKSMLMMCEQYDDARWTQEYYDLAKAYADDAINEDGTFKNFKKGNIDNINAGKVLFELYRHESLLDKKNGTNRAARYKKAADFLHDYLKNEYSRIQLPEAKGCFFHKDIYPNQMWLDGLYMGAAFYAEWLENFAPNDTRSWSDIARQFIVINEHTYDPEYGLNYHAWSADPTEPNSFWARKEAPFKGCSQEFWGRGMGWYFAALVDVLEVMPKDHPDYATLKQIAGQIATGLRRWQDKKSGVWYQLLRYDSSFKGACGLPNYLESSASGMFAYAYLKGVRIGVLDPAFRRTAEKAYQGVLKSFITRNPDGTINIESSCRSAGLGPARDPHRDGSASYYLCGKDVTRVNNEGKAIGPFIMASLEYEKLKNGSK